MSNTSNPTIGRYVLTESLGKGSQGTVYLAKDPTLDRFVAVKVLTTGQAELCQMGHTGAPLEAIIASKLNHPNIVPIYDAGECDLGPYLVFEYVRGSTLAKLLSDNGPYDIETAAPLIASILRAMAVAHDAKIVHLDLSPRNVLLDERGVPRLMDFGLSQFVDARTDNLDGDSDVITGTLRYMAPEHFQGDPLDARADVFALGSTFFEMVTGQKLMQGSTFEEIQDRIVTEPATLEPLQGLQHGVAFTHFLEGALQKDRDGRYADCGIMRDSFDLFLKESDLSVDGSSAADHSTIEFLLRRMQRKKDFPTISSTLADINRLTSSEANASADQLANVILRDLALTSKLLKLVNSAFYGQRTAEITSISHAVVFLGVDTVRMTANSLTLFGHLRGDSAELKDSMIKAFLSGLIGRHLAQRARLPDVEEAFICGMCQNLGENLVIYYFPEEFAEINDVRREQKLDKAAASRGVLGVSYADLGAAVAQKWSLPQSIIDTIKGLPPGPVRTPENAADRLRDIAVFSTHLCDVFAERDSEAVTASLHNLVDAFQPSVDVDFDYALKVINAAFEKLKQYSTLFELNVDKSTYCRSVRTWLDAEREAAVDDQVA